MAKSVSAPALRSGRDGPDTRPRRSWLKRQRSVTTRGKPNCPCAASTLFRAPASHTRVAGAVPALAATFQSPNVRIQPPRPQQDTCLQDPINAFVASRSRTAPARSRSVPTQDGVSPMSSRPPNRRDQLERCALTGPGPGPGREPNGPVKPWGGKLSTKSTGRSGKSATDRRAGTVCAAMRRPPQRRAGTHITGAMCRNCTPKKFLKPWVLAKTCLR